MGLDRFLLICPSGKSVPLLSLSPRHCEERLRRSNPAFVPRRKSWIASRSLSSGARSRDPLARNDGERGSTAEKNPPEAKPPADCRYRATRDVTPSSPPSPPPPRSPTNSPRPPPRSTSLFPPPC